MKIIKLTYTIYQDKSTEWLLYVEGINPFRITRKQANCLIRKMVIQPTYNFISGAKETDYLPS